MTQALLQLKDIQAGYGESIVLRDISLEVREGEIVCLIGANGAGKTTTTRVITGLTQPSRGKLMFDGDDLGVIEPHKRVEKGLSLSPEGRQVFGDFTVQENLFMGSYSKRGRALRKESLEKVLTIFPRLRERLAQKAGLMSGGEQQMLAIGRALMGRPRLLILDEPSLGLSPKLVMEVYAAVSEIVETGISILFVEQNVQAALSLAHRGYVLSNGSILLEGTAAELRASSQVQEAFLGKRKFKPAAANEIGGPHV